MKQQSEFKPQVPSYLFIHAKLWPFDHDTVYDVPNTPGVYALWRYGELVFYGHASGPESSIRMGLAEHLAGLHDRRTRTASHCSWETSADPESRSRQLLAQFWDTYNRLPAWNRPQRPLS